MIPGDVRAQVLQEPVGASHADQGRKSGVPPIFLGLRGHKESNGTPHFTPARSLAEPQGGGTYSNIYKDTCACIIMYYAINSNFYYHLNLFFYWGKINEDEKV